MSGGIKGQVPKQNFVVKGRQKLEHTNSFPRPTPCCLAVELSFLLIQLSAKSQKTAFHKLAAN